MLPSRWESLMLPPRGSHLVPRGFPGVACTTRGPTGIKSLWALQDFSISKLGQSKFSLCCWHAMFSHHPFLHQSYQVFLISIKADLERFCQVLINVVLAFLTTSSPDDCSMSASPKVHLRRSLFKRVLKRSFILKLCCMLPSFKVNRHRIPHD